MTWFSWIPFFRRTQVDDYETILSVLAANVEKRKIRLADIRLREQRAKFAATLYTLSAWVLYVGLWYSGTLPSLYIRSAAVERLVKALPVVFGPIIILFVLRVVQIWYTSKGDAEEKALQGVLKEQRSKVDEIKKKTNYYSTHDLIQRYEGGPGPGSPRSSLAQPVAPVTPQRKVPRQSVGPPTPLSPQEILSALQSPQLPPTPSRKQWYDKLADAVLGDEDDTARYALICNKCFAHNGLVKENALEELQYVCPKCQHLNPAKRSKGQASVKSPGSSGNPGSPHTIQSPSREHYAMDIDQ